jgi:hypothetical protein
MVKGPGAATLGGKRNPLLITILRRRQQVGRRQLRTPRRRQAKYPSFSDLVLYLAVFPLEKAGREDPARDSIGPSAGVWRRALSKETDASDKYSVLYRPRQPFNSQVVPGMPQPPGRSLEGLSQSLDWRLEWSCSW